MGDRPLDDARRLDGDGRDGVRSFATALVAVAALASLFVASAAVFLLIAALLGGRWALALGAVAALAFLLWLGNRLVRVAANQNRDPLG